VQYDDEAGPPAGDDGLGFLDAEVEALERQALRRSLRVVDGAQARSVVIDGRAVVNFSSNNYLGLADHPAIVAAAVAAAQEWGAGAGASRLIVGNQRPQQSLERALAQFHGTESARLFVSGYQANVGTIGVLVGAEDVVFSDALNHASIIDGCRLARARVVVYPHNDMAALRRSAREASGRRKLIVSDSVFSMDGDRAPVAELAEITREVSGILMLDEAHGTGVVGPGGRGVAAEVGVVPGVHMGTLSKAAGVAGGYVAGRRSLGEMLVNRARSFVFTTAAPPMVVAAAEAALSIVAGAEGDRRRSRLGEIIRAVREGLAELGLLAAGAGTTPIFPVLVGDAGRAMEVAAGMLAEGLYAQGIRPPTVPRGTARLRAALMATHTDEDVERLLGALRRYRDRGLIPTHG
jgi:8-amino-7-oxononanoate synthase